MSIEDYYKLIKNMLLYNKKIKFKLKNLQNKKLIIYFTN